MTSPLSSNGLYGPEASAAEQSRMELQARLSGLGGLNGRQISPEAKAAKLREACEGFESIFIQKMWQEMRNAVPQTGILSGREERFWQDMYDQELSKSMTRAGGIGLADMMYEQLSRSLVSASRSAAGAVQTAGFAPSAAPLVPQQGEDLIDPPSLRAEAIYEEPAAQPAAAPAEARSLAQAAVPAAPMAENRNLATDVYTAAPNTAHKSTAAEHKAADLNQASGLAMAHQAMRDAGDKLGSGAVRPARQPRPASRARRADARPVEPVQPVAQAVPQTGAPGAINQGGLVPGSPEALRAALDNARTGATPGDGQQPLNLSNLVAQVQNQNLAAQAQEQAAQMQGQIAREQTGRQTQGAVAANEEVPGIVRVRRTTNTPQKGNRDIKRQAQAVRVLNVDNVGVNSRQGQGLSAYHAQQDMAARLNGGEGANGSKAMPAALAPLTGAGQAAQASRESASGIPPLTAADARI